MISFLKTILILLLVYFGIKFLWRLSAPYLMRYVAKKAAQRFEGAFGQNPFQGTTSEPTGKTSVDKMPKKQTSKSKVVGEYVDFEEIEE